MLEVPDYLKTYASEIKQKGKNFTFKLKCTCSHDTFAVYENCYTKEEEQLKKEYEEKVPDTGYHTVYGGVDSEGQVYSYIKKFGIFKKYIEFPKVPVFMTVTVIKVVCGQCNENIAVFDSRYHGYDSPDSTEEQLAYVPYFEQIKEKSGNVLLNIEQYDEEDVPPDHFSRIRVYIISGDKKKKILDLETG